MTAANRKEAKRTDRKRILLRAPAWMVEVMDRAAENAGISREQWMERALEKSLPPHPTAANGPCINCNRSNRGRANFCSWRCVAEYADYVESGE